MAWLVAQVADLALESFGAPEWVMKTLLLFMALGFPGVLIFAWAFEMTPEGIRREKDVDRSRSITSVTGRKLDRTIVSLLAIAVVLLLVDKFALREAPVAPEQQQASETPAASRAPDEHSIAVLPFVDMSEAGDSAYFADGLSEELLNLLAKIKELQVAGRTSSFAFKGQNQDLRLIAEQLDVENILEGSVRRSGNKVRVTAQLVSARDGYHMWSETYDRELTDIFAIQDDIASHVVEALRIELLGAQSAPVTQYETSSAEAYNAYLLGRSKLREMSFAPLRQAMQHFKDAIGLDTEFAPAYAGLAETAARMFETGAMSRDEYLDLAGQAVDRALQLDPGSAEALAMLGSVRVAQNRFEEAAEAYRRSLELNPNSVTALAAYGDALLDAGDADEALKIFQRAAQLNPLSVNDQWNMADALEKLARCDEAMEVFARVRALDDNDASGWYGASRCMLWQGRIDRAIQMQREASKRDPDDFELSGGLASQYLQLGGLEEAQQWVNRALESGPGEPVPLAASVKLARLQGNPDKAGKLSGDALAGRLTARHGSSDTFLEAVLAQAKSAADYQHLLERERFYSPLLFENPPRFTAWWQPYAAVRIAYMYRKLERAEEYEQLMRATRDYLDRLPPGLKRTYLVYPAAQMAVLQGNSEEALNVLEAGAAGHIMDWFELPNDPILQPIADNPRFKALIAGIESRTSAQLAALRASDARDGSDAMDKQRH